MRTKSIATRSVRRSRRLDQSRAPLRGTRSAAVQIFLSKLDTFIGTELFDAESPVTVGRHHRSLLQLDGDTVSRCHCQLMYIDGSLFVEDLDSGNGTYVNRRRIIGRTRVAAKDAISIGQYTLKIRVLNGEGRKLSGIKGAEEPTRIEAILNIDSSTEDSIDDGLDRRLYQDAIRRTTGKESAKRPIPPTFDDAPKTTEDSTMLTPEDLPPIEDQLDPKVEERLRDLDELIAALDAKQRSRSMEGPWTVPDLETLEDAEPVSLDGYLAASRRMSTCEFARDLASRLAVDGELVAKRAHERATSIAEPEELPQPEPQQAKVIPLHPTRPPPLPKDQLLEEESTTLESQEIEIDLHAESPLPPPLPGKKRKVQARLMTPTSMQVDVQKAPKKIRKESSLDDVWTGRDVQITGATPKDPVDEAATAPAKETVAPTARPTIKEPADDAATAPAGEPVNVHAVLQQPLDDEDATLAADESPDPNFFDGLEISARCNDQLVDIGVLRKAGEQYILGHPTPQGTLAPAKVHAGLRLVRINQDRTVDLVFPRDAAGHLVRGSVTKMFGELTEERKYSCLRMEVQDVATIILGKGQRATTYHIHFLRRPRSIFRALRGV